MSYFYAFNGIFLVWAIMALLYFICNTLNVSCSGSTFSLYLVQHYFIAWTCSYGFEALVPLVCIYSGKEAKHYMTSYIFLTLATIFKLAVLGSLMVGAWQPIGLCYIPSTYKMIIVLINSLEIVCLLIDMVLIVRIKAVNR